MIIVATEVDLPPAHIGEAGDGGLDIVDPAALLSQLDIEPGIHPIARQELEEEILSRPVRIVVGHSETAEERMRLVGSAVDDMGRLVGQRYGELQLRPG